MMMMSQVKGKTPLIVLLMSIPQFLFLVPLISPPFLTPPPFQFHLDELNHDCISVSEE